jgi:hypothetical protein
LKGEVGEGDIIVADYEKDKEELTIKHKKKRSGKEKKEKEDDG